MNFFLLFFPEMMSIVRFLVELRGNLLAVSHHFCETENEYIVIEI